MWLLFDKTFSSDKLIGWRSCDYSTNCDRKRPQKRSFNSQLHVRTYTYNHYNKPKTISLWLPEWRFYQSKAYYNESTAGADASVEALKL